jgi:signal transduction histidine kinase
MKTIDSWLASWKTSLRARVAFGVGLPVLIALLVFSLTHYWRGLNRLEDQIRLTSIRLGEMTLGAFRHAMLINDQQHLEEIIADVNAMESIRRIQIVNLLGQVKIDSLDQDLGATFRVDEPGCSECHQYKSDKRPRSTHLSQSSEILRISIPIDNEPACIACHPSTNKHIGVMFLDIIFSDVDALLLTDLRANLAISVGSTLLITIGVYLLIQWQVVRKVEAFQTPLRRYSMGDFTARVPVEEGAKDELSQLGSAFNQMADKLQAAAREQSERSEVRQRAITEERERIGRELHDGVAQLLGYVNTKAMAVRLMLTGNDHEKAEEHLRQLEEASRELFVDIREAILGLKTSGKTWDSLPDAIEEYSAQFSRLSDAAVEVKIDPGLRGVKLPAETELQLLRIVQEALTNVRKHAQATDAWITLEMVEGGKLELMIGDNGVGFDADPQRQNNRPQFGLGTMRERAEALGAQYSLDTEPNAGTRISVKMDMPEA